MRSALRSTKNWAKGYSEAEKLVRQCTCNEEGPPDPRDLRALANLTLRDVNTYKSVWTLLWNRTKHFQYIRHVHRGMQTMEYLLIHGHERVIQDISDNLLTIKRLTTYKYYKDGSREVAGDVREEAKKLLSMMEDMQALKRKREDAAKNRPKMDKIQGFGSDNYNSATEPQVKSGEIQTVHKWQDSPSTPPAASSEPGAADDSETESSVVKKKKKKKKKKKHKEAVGEATDDFDAFPDINFDSAPKEKERSESVGGALFPFETGASEKKDDWTLFPEAISTGGGTPQSSSAGGFHIQQVGEASPVVLESLSGPPVQGKVKKKAAAAPVSSDVLGFGLEPGSSGGEKATDSVAPPSGNFSFGDGDDWVSSLTSAKKQTDLLDDVFSSAPATQQQTSPGDIFAFASQPAQPAAAATPEVAATTDNKNESLYGGFVNTDDIFGSMPKKQKPKVPAGAKTMAQLAAEKNMNNSFGTQPTQATQQTNIFTQMNQPADPFAAVAAAPVQQQQNPFGFGAPQQQNPFAATQPAANPFGMPQQQQQNPFGMQNAFNQPPVQQQQPPLWGAQPLYQQPQQQKQQANPFDNLGGWS